MSNSLLKRSLQIVEESLDSNKRARPSHSKKKEVHKQKKSTSAFELIPENQRLIKISKDRKTQEKSMSIHVDLAFVLNKFICAFSFSCSAKFNELKQKPKMTIKQAKNKINRSKDRISENVRKLLMLQSAVKLSDEATETLLRRARSQRYVIPEQKAAEDSSTAFTEEDFLKFEKEYFVN